jgi:hypothetical protein
MRYSIKGENGMNKKDIISERLKRQSLQEPLSDSSTTEDYIQLFRLLQPVAPVFNSMPGSPPQLVHRTTFDDTFLTNDFREKHQLVKGRFQDGRICYVFEEDLGLYSSVYHII